MKLKSHLYYFAIDRFPRSGSNYTSHVAAASTTDRVTYTITPTATQSFNVYARWVAQATNASNATYTIAPNTAGSTPLVVTVNQRQDGGTWNYLGTVNLNTANQMTVTLSGQGNGIVMADAVKIVPNTTSATQASAFNIYTDHLNTPREIRNHANQLRWTWYPEVSGAFGADLPNENPNTPALGVFAYNLRFPGQLYDPTSQLSYNYYRDYSSRTGRYIESDPIGLEGGINTYGYVGGNPMSRIDPDGRFFFLPIIAGLAGGGTGGAGATVATLSALGLAGAVTWNLQQRPKSSTNNSASNSPLASIGADAGSSSSSSSSSENSCDPDKNLCDSQFEFDQNKCYERYGNGLRGSGFTSNLNGCLAWATFRRTACYNKQPDPGPYPGYKGDNGPQGR